MRWRDEATIRHRQGQNHQSKGFVQIFGSKLLDFFQTFAKNNVLFLQTHGYQIGDQ